MIAQYPNCREGPPGKGEAHPAKVGTQGRLNYEPHHTRLQFPVKLGEPVREVIASQAAWHFARWLAQEGRRDVFP